MLLTAIGLVLDTPAASFAARRIDDLLHGTRPSDPFMYAAVCLGVSAVSRLTTWALARRAMCVDPLVALGNG